MHELQAPRHNALDALKGLEHSPASLSAGAIERAREIVYIIESERAPSPFVFPTEIGGVQFEWKGTDRELDLEILPDSAHLAYLTIIDGQPVTEGEISGDYEQQVITLLNWISRR